MDKGILLATKTLVESICACMSLHPGPEWRIFRMSGARVAYR